MLVHLADRVLNRPLLITPDKAQVVLQVLGGRIGVDAARADRFEGDPFKRDEEGRLVRDADGFVALAPYPVTAEGVAIISIVGSLVSRGAWIGANSGLVSYEGIKRQLKEVKADQRVKAVILDLHTPGGEVIGAFETAALVRELSAEKPTIAIANGLAASAGYVIASGAREIVAIETGVVGSIGVVLMHADFSRMLAADGITPTLIFAGAHKVDGNPFEPLPDTVRADLQTEMDAVYGLFLKTVEAGRGKRTTAEAARATEARTFTGKAAVDAGLADRIGTFESVLAELSSARQARPTPTQTRRRTMSEDTNTPSATPEAVSAAELEKAKASGATDGAKASTDRLAAVLGADGIKGDGKRMSAALDLAVKSPAMSAEDVVAFVAANVAPTAAAKAEDAADPAAYENERLATAGQAQPGGKPQAKSGLSARVTKQIEGMKASAAG